MTQSCCVTPNEMSDQKKEQAREAVDCNLLLHLLSKNKIFGVLACVPVMLFSNTVLTGS
jgi:hypothetical protein